MGNQKYEAFIKTAELGSFKKAADILGYTQAGISYMLNTLENEFGVTLFLRNYGGAILTADGRELLPLIKEICNNEHKLYNKINELKNLDSGSIRIGAFTSVHVNWLPGIVKLFLNEHPNICIDILCCDDMENMKDMIRNGDIDCGFCVLPTDPNFTVIHLVFDPMFVILPENHSLAASTFFPISALSEYPYIKLENGTFNEMDNIFSLYGVTPNISISTKNDYAIMAMVSEGFGFSIYPELLLKHVSFPLIYKKLEIPAYREIALVTRSRETASSITVNFIEHTKKWVDNFYLK